MAIYPYTGYQEYPDVVGTAMKSFAATQQAIANRLAMEQQREFNKAYPQMLQQQIDLGAAETALAKEQARLYGPITEADIAYKNRIAQAALYNADIAGINAQLAQAKLPSELRKIGLEADLAQMEMGAYVDYLNKISGGQSSPSGFTGQIPLPHLPGMSPVNYQTQAIPQVSETEQVLSREAIPDDYLGPADISIPHPGERIYEQRNLSESERAAVSAEKAEKAKQSVRSRQKLADEIGDKATTGAEQNAVLDTMVSYYGDIPNWNRGPILGELKAISGDSQIYEMLHSGLTLDALEKITGTASEGDREEVKNMFPGRKMDPNKMQEAAVIMQILNDRDIKYLNMIENNPDHNPTQLRSAFAKFVNDNSIFDDKRWQEFLIRRRKGMSAEEATNDEIKELERQLGGGLF